MSHWAVALLLLLKWDPVHSWTTTIHSSARSARFENAIRSKRALSASTGSTDDGTSPSPEDDEPVESTFQVEGEDCFDLCEIDWDLMPSEEKLEPHDLVDSDTAKLRLELQWKARENEEDCVLTEIDSCGDFCEECAGRGWIPCRFCNGSTKISMNGRQKIDCPVCNQLGHESCKTCCGSGRIAPWTSLAGEA